MCSLAKTSRLKPVSNRFRTEPRFRGPVQTGGRDPNRPNTESCTCTCTPLGAVLAVRDRVILADTCYQDFILISANFNKIALSQFFLKCMVTVTNEQI
jgi:hypothetical protein